MAERGRSRTSSKSVPADSPRLRCDPDLLFFSLYVECVDLEVEDEVPEHWEFVVRVHIGKKATSHSKPFILEEGENNVNFISFFTVPRRLISGNIENEDLADSRAFNRNNNRRNKLSSKHGKESNNGIETNASGVDDANLTISLSRLMTSSDGGKPTEQPVAVALNVELRQLLRGDEDSRQDADSNSNLFSGAFRFSAVPLLNQGPTTFGTAAVYCAAQSRWAIETPYDASRRNGPSMIRVVARDVQALTALEHILPEEAADLLREEEAREEEEKQRKRIIDGFLPAEVQQHSKNIAQDTRGTMPNKHMRKNFHGEEMLDAEARKEQHETTSLVVLESKEGKRQVYAPICRVVEVSSKTSHAAGLLDLQTYRMEKQDRETVKEEWQSMTGTSKTAITSVLKVQMDHNDLHDTNHSGEEFVMEENDPLAKNGTNGDGPHSSKCNIGASTDAKRTQGSNMMQLNNHLGSKIGKDSAKEDMSARTIYQSARDEEISQYYVMNPNNPLEIEECLNDILYQDGLMTTRGGQPTTQPKTPTTPAPPVDGSDATSALDPSLQSPHATGTSAQRKTDFQNRRINAAFPELVLNITPIEPHVQEDASSDDDSLIDMLQSSRDPRKRLHLDNDVKDQNQHSIGNPKEGRQKTSKTSEDCYLSHQQDCKSRLRRFLVLRKRLGLTPQTKQRSPVDVVLETVNAAILRLRDSGNDDLLYRRDKRSYDGASDETYDDREVPTVYRRDLLHLKRLYTELATLNNSTNEKVTVPKMNSTINTKRSGDDERETQCDEGHKQRTSQTLDNDTRTRRKSSTPKRMEISPLASPFVPVLSFVDRSRIRSQVETDIELKRLNLLGKDVCSPPDYGPQTNIDDQSDVYKAPLRGRTKAEIDLQETGICRDVESVSTNCTSLQMKEHIIRRLKEGGAVNTGREVHDRSLTLFDLTSKDDETKDSMENKLNVSPKKKFRNNTRTRKELDPFDQHFPRFFEKTLAK